MKKLILIILIFTTKPVKKEIGMNKAQLIDAIASASKLTKADAG